MTSGARWIDLLDPTAEEISAESPVTLHPGELSRLSGSAGDPRTARPTIEAYDDHVLGVLLVAVSVPDEDRVYYQQVDFVLTPETVMTVRKTPSDGEPFSLEAVQDACDAHGSPSPGLVVYHLIDEAGERYLDLIDSLNDEIDELEAGIDAWSSVRVRKRLAELREDVVVIRQTLAPTRDAVRRVVDGRVDPGNEEVHGRALTLYFADAYDKLLRATESLDVSRELLSSARDYHQSKIAQEQNEVVKKLTVIASLLLFPTFVVGVYGQNFDVMPELHWHYGYLFSWAVIVVSTIGQLAFFRWKKWI